MSEIRLPLRLYVAAVLAAACAAFAVFVGETSAPKLPLAVMLLAFAAIAQLRPIHLTQKTKVTVEDTATFAGALLLAPALAFAVAAGSTLLVYIRRRGAPWFEGAFNSAVSGLAALSGAWTFAAMGGERESVDAYAFAAVLAAGVMYLVNTMLVDVAVGLQLRRNPLTTGWPVHRRDLPQSSALYGLGALGAIVGDVYPPAVVLLALPVAAVFASMREAARLRSQTREAIVEFAKLIDVRDRYTHGHSQRVAALAERVAVRLRLDPSQVALVRDAALLHDLGKIHTSDHVLRKPGPLDPVEQDEMRRHAEAGAELLRKLPEFWEGASLVRAHHERYDGTGYPRGLSGADLPLEAAVIAVADSWDAMTSDRPYRRALAHADAIAEMRRGRGSQWTPAVVDALLALVDEDHAVPMRARTAAMEIRG
jgi:putative nucleotidyltransferase with HDIG domain